MKINIRGGRKWLVAVVACGVVSTCGITLRPRVAQASGGLSFNDSFSLAEFFTALLIVPPVIANEMLLLTSSIANGVAASKGQRPLTKWLALGYTTSIINIIGGGALVVAGLVAKSYQQTGGTDSYGYPIFGNVAKVDGAMVGWGTAILALGGAGLGLTIWGHSKPAQPSPSLKLRPIVGADSRGGIFAGAALELAGF